MSLRARTLCLLLGFAGIAACGGQTGEGDEGPNQCTDLPPAPLGDTEPSPLGFSAADVLEFAAEQHLSLARTPTTSPPLAATLIVRPRPGSGRFIATRQQRDIGMPEACQGRIELDTDIELRVTTPSGELQVSAAGMLKADSRYRAELTAQLTQPAFDALRTFDLAPGENLGALELRALLTPEGSAGELTAEIELLVRVVRQPEPPRGGAPRAGDFIMSRHAQVARWPADSKCGDGQLPLEHDRSLFEVSPEEVVEMFTGPRTITWNDGTTTTLQLEAAGVELACLADLDPFWSQPISWPAIVPENPADFGIPLELSIVTEDRRFSARIATVLQYRPKKTGGLEIAWIVHEATLAPGDPGGWTTDAADLQTRRTTLLHLAWPPTEAIDSRLLLLGPPAASECGSTTRMCVGTAGIAPTLVRGTIE